MFRRQLGSEQIIPATYELSDPQFTFEYAKVNTSLHGRVEELSKAWRDRYMVSNDRLRNRVAEGYQSWYYAKEKNVNAPEHVIMAPPSQEEEDEEREALEVTFERLKGEVCRLTEEQRKTSRKIAELTEQVKGLDLDLNLEAKNHEATKGKLQTGEEDNFRDKEHIKKVESKIRWAGCQKEWKEECGKIAKQKDQACEEVDKQTKVTDEVRTKNIELKKQLVQLKAKLKKKSQRSSSDKKDKKRGSSTTGEASRSLSLVLYKGAF